MSVSARYSGFRLKRNGPSVTSAAVGLSGLSVVPARRKVRIPRVLREVGLVDTRDEGRQRIYRVNAHPLKPIHDWVKTYEQSWSQRFDRLDVVLEELKEMQDGGGGSDE